MKRLLNTLYVTGTNRYLSLDGENVVVLEEREEIGRVPLHNLTGYCDLWVYRRKPGVDGGLRPEKHRPDIYVWKREIPCKSHREK